MNRHMSRPFVPAKLSAPTVAQIEAVTDVLEHRWSSNALMVQDRYTQAIERDDHNAASKWALAGAISTDKILVLKGRPTEIMGHIHAHRHDLSQVMDKLASALRPVHNQVHNQITVDARTDTICPDTTSQGTRRQPRLVALKREGQGVRVDAMLGLDNAEHDLVTS